MTRPRRPGAAPAAVVLSVTGAAAGAFAALAVFDAAALDWSMILSFFGVVAATHALVMWASLV